MKTGMGYSTRSHCCRAAKRHRTKANVVRDRPGRGSGMYASAQQRRCLVGGAVRLRRSCRLGRTGNGPCLGRQHRILVRDRLPPELLTALSPGHVVRAQSEESPENAPPAPLAPWRAQAFTALESRISASATHASPSKARLCSRVHWRHRAQRGTCQVVPARVRAPSLGPQTQSGHETRRAGARPLRGRQER